VSIVATTGSIRELGSSYLLVRVTCPINKRALYRRGANALAAEGNFGELDSFYPIQTCFVEDNYGLYSRIMDIRGTKGAIGELGSSYLL
jgi:hypothetical protein